ncbi:MAG: DNA repair protein RecN [Actinomycetota bacterium]
MLIELTAEGLGVIDEAELSLEPGMTALTGETGAGKTLLVVALSLLCGGRADRTLVRPGARAADISGRFVVPAAHEGVRLLRSYGVLEETPGNEVELVVARSVAADGRSKARINGQMVSVAILSEIGGTLVDIAGQSEHHRLASPAVQRQMIDEFAGPRAKELAAEVSDAVRRAAAAGARLDELTATVRERRRELDVLSFEIGEIEAAGVRPGESDELRELIARLANAEAIARGLTAASEALKGEGGAAELMSTARTEIDALANSDEELGPLAARLDAAAIEVTDVAEELTGRIVAADPDALEDAHGRLAALARLTRKYGDDETDVLAYLERARARRSELERGDEDLTDIRREVEEQTTRAHEAAAALSELRRVAAAKLETEIDKSFEGLALKGAHFRVLVGPRTLYEGGLDQVEFAVVANTGDEPRPITKVASGGELSRVALALHLATASTVAPTTVFDEVDSGVGGEAAQSVGRALAGLAHRSRAQVLVVTHLPQVAAFAAHHVRVVKTTVSGRTSATVEPVEGDERVVELSRMLAGMPRSERAREHAVELLELADRSRRAVVGA